MGSTVKLANDLYLETSSIVHNGEINLETYLNNLSANLLNIKIDTIWTRSKGNYGENRVNFDASKYDLFIIEYNLYTGTNYYSSKVCTTLNRIYEISDMFIYNNHYYSGRRDFFIDDTGAYFYQATNDGYNIDNNWYNPVKIVGIKINTNKI